ncbi:MAG TPA: hypothetical protein VK914_00605 [bacterium]|jgi:hypothetical protein|nr:hypothetical protein [bacterium]
MDRKKLKNAQLLVLLACIAAFASSCFWYGPGYGPRRRWHPRYYDGGGWHEGYYYR